MNRIIRAGLLLGAFGLALSQPPSAVAETKKVCNEITGECRLVVVEEGSSGGSQDGRTGYPACGSLSGNLESQMPEAPKKGEVWRPIKCRNSSGAVVTVWSDSASPLFLAANPEVMARSLLAQVDLDPTRIGLTPKGTDAMALVGLPVWLWVDDPSRTTWGPATISAGGVSLTAQVESMTWNLGDGFTISCGKGTEWKRGMGSNRSPTCGHTYDKQGTYTVTATSHWVARWSGYGQSGMIRFDLSSSRPLTVGELQVLGTKR